MTMVSDTKGAASGRPAEYSDEIGMAICDRLVEGDSLRKICADSSMPDRDTVRRWLAQHEDFRKKYHFAERLALDFFQDDTLDIVTDFRPTWVQKVSRGKVVTVRDPKAFGRCRLRVEVRNWVVDQKLSLKSKRNR